MLDTCGAFCTLITCDKGEGFASSSEKYAASNKFNEFRKFRMKSGVHLKK